MEKLTKSKKRYIYGIILITMVIIIMWYFGTYNVILSEPVNVGSLDVRAIVLLLSIAIGFGIGIFMFRKEQKK